MKLSDEAKQAKNEYQREYRRKNPDKIKGYNNAYWERKAANTPIEKRIAVLHQQGKSLREIAEEFGISHMKVSRILKVVK